ncbi:MAG: glycosyltransferase family 2 protein [Trueperaceae bacterium]|nr:glycosyltransferase family 2 protein [Trueperaceae bacterium]
MTVILPVRNEAGFIAGALTSIQRAAEQAPTASVEILVIDGLSDDETREIVEGFAAADARISLLDNPQRTVPHAMNLGIRSARGDVVIRLDGHAEIESDYIVNALEELRAHPECVCVGGPIANIGRDATSSAISQAMSSSFGVGNARFRTGGQDGYVDTLAFGAYRRSELIAIGLFDEALTRNEDDDLNFRLVTAGNKLWFSNRIRSRYYVRAELGKLYRQYFQYGYWKVYVNRKHNTVTSIRQLAPPVLVSSLAILGLLSVFLLPARPLLLILLGVYLATAAYFALRAARSLDSAATTFLAFLALHFGYGIGYLAGFRDFAVLQRQPIINSTRLTR